MNRLLTDSQADQERLAFLGTVLAAGLLRVLARKSSRISGAVNDSPLDCRHKPTGDVGQHLPDTSP
jgi:hypothetical protein